MPLRNERAIGRSAAVFLAVIVISGCSVLFDGDPHLQGSLVDAGVDTGSDAGVDAAIDGGLPDAAECICVDGELCISPGRCLCDLCVDGICDTEGICDPCAGCAGACDGFCCDRDGDSFVVDDPRCEGDIDCDDSNAMAFPGGYPVCGDGNRCGGTESPDAALLAEEFGSLPVTNLGAADLFDFLHFSAPDGSGGLHVRVHEGDAYLGGYDALGAVVSEPITVGDVPREVRLGFGEGEGALVPFLGAILQERNRLAVFEVPQLNARTATPVDWLPPIHETAGLSFQSRIDSQPEPIWAGLVDAKMRPFSFVDGSVRDFGQETRLAGDAIYRTEVVGGHPIAFENRADGTIYAQIITGASTNVVPLASTEGDVAGFGETVVFFTITSDGDLEVLQHVGTTPETSVLEIEGLRGVAADAFGEVIAVVFALDDAHGVLFYNPALGGFQSGSEESPLVIPLALPAGSSQMRVSANLITDGAVPLGYEVVVAAVGMDNQLRVSGFRVCTVP